MSSIHTKNLEIFNAKQFKESVSEPLNSSLYLTIGGVQSWPNDAEPVQANTSGATFYEVWNNMIGGKLVTGNDMSHAIPRINWVANTVYNAYDDRMSSSQLYDSNNKFYVVTSDYKVYKCIANSGSGNVSSQVPFSITTTSTTTLADGYVWKYMYSIPPAEQIKFTTDSYIPVKLLTEDDNSLQWQVQQDAIKGSIEAIKIVNSGNNYIGGISVSITGDGSDANAFAQLNTTSNTISNIIIDNPGKNYTYANVTITSATGSNGSLRAVISPPGGHGSNPLVELGGSYLIINPRLKGSENGILTINNQYRQVCLIEDPYVRDTTTVATNTVFSQLTVLTLNGTSVEYLEDEIVYQGASLASAFFKGTVVEWDSSNNIIKLANIEGSPDTELLIGDSTAAARFVASVTFADLEHNSGQLLYIDNVLPIERAEDQTEDFKIVLKF